MRADLVILGIETSCDDTSVAVLKGGNEILSNLVSSQTDIHAHFGGVVPEIASRAHLELINPLLEKALKTAGVNWKDIDIISVTKGPGLIGALLVGVTAAKALSFALSVPMVAVNHIESHIFSNFLEGEVEAPFLALVASGGHTTLIYVPELLKYEVVGQTLDDAAGEAFDKVARLLGLGYPGGPAIDKASKGANDKAVDFPIGLNQKGNPNFSFSGVKSAVYYLWRDRRIEYEVKDVAASFQRSVVEALVSKTVNTALQFEAKRVLLSGGVIANSRLRKAFSDVSSEFGFELFMPPAEFCTDNAAMVASAGYYRWLKGERAGLDLNPEADLRLREL